MARTNNLEFLSDTIPQTVPYKQVREKKAAKTLEKEKGQTVLPIGGVANGRRKTTGTTAASKKVTPEIEAIVDREVEMEEAGSSGGGTGGGSGGGGGLGRFAFSG